MSKWPPLIEIDPTGSFGGSIRPPGSKSITNRALLCAALAKGESRLLGVLDSDDTRVMLESLRRLGVRIEGELADGIVVVHGCSGRFPADSIELDVRGSGTTMRFLAAAAVLADGTTTITGNERMRKRPIGDLVHALRQLGVNIRCLEAEDFPPVAVGPRMRTSSALPSSDDDPVDIDNGAVTRLVLRGDTSSQFISALLMVGPYFAPLELQIHGPLISQPYVEMTCRTMEAFGVRVERSSQRLCWIFPKPSTYRAATYQIEPDATAASYFWAAAAITGKSVLVRGLSASSIQGDVQFVELLERMGCLVTRRDDAIGVAGGSLRGIEADMSDISDTAQTLAIVALFAAGPTRITGIAHARVKETDRVGDLARELRRLGATVTEFHNGLLIKPATYRGCTVETYDDHRMAMSFAVAGLRIPGIKIANPACVQKTYPNFFRDLDSLRKPE